MTKEEIRDKALKFISERASGTAEEMSYYAEILTEFAYNKANEWHYAIFFDDFEPFKKFDVDMSPIKEIKNRYEKYLTSKKILANCHLEASRSENFERLQTLERLQSLESLERLERLERFNVLQNEKCVSVKTEKLNDLKNRISFVLKDATLQQGFEIICKRIAELEKENEDLKKENEGLKVFESHCDEIEEDAKVIAKENAELKEKLDKIRKYLVYDIFDRFKYLENLIKISQETQEELSKRILEQQKTIGSLTDTIDELKAHCKAVDEVNEKMKCCGNCGFAIHNRLDGTFCNREAEYRQANEKCNKWEKAE